MVSAVETHPQRDLIMSLLVDRVPVRRIAAQLTPPLHWTALQRYKKSRGVTWMEKTLRKIKADTAQQLSVSNSTQNGSGIVVSEVSASQLAKQLLVSRLAERYDQVDADLAQVAAGKELSGKAALMNADRGYMELHSKLLGLLQDQTQQTLLVMAAPGSNVTINTQPADLPDSTETVLDLMPDEYQTEP